MDCTGLDIIDCFKFWLNLGILYSSNTFSIFISKSIDKEIVTFVFVPLFTIIVSLYLGTRYPGKELSQTDYTYLRYVLLIEIFAILVIYIIVIFLYPKSLSGDLEIFERPSIVIFVGVISVLIPLMMNFWAKIIHDHFKHIVDISFLLRPENGLEDNNKIKQHIKNVQADFEAFKENAEMLFTLPFYHTIFTFLVSIVTFLFASLIFFVDTEDKSLFIVNIFIHYHSIAASIKLVGIFLYGITRLKPFSIQSKHLPKYIELTEMLFSQQSVKKTI